MRHEVRQAGEDWARLVRAAREGHGDRLDVLLDLLAREIYPTAAALALGSQEADELVADTISRVFERLDQLRDPGAVVGWSRRILLNRFVDGRRKILQRRRFQVDALELPVAWDSANLEIRDAIQRLPRRDQVLLALHYWGGYSTPECAEQLNIPVGTAKSRLHAALERLRAELEVAS